MLATFPLPPGDLERKDAVVGRGSITRDPESNWWTFLSGLAVSGSVATCTIDFADPADRQWALDTWRSIGHLSAKGSLR